MSGLISAPVFFETFPAVDPAHQNQGASKAALQQAFYVAIYEIGCLVGALFALGYGDKLGRRRMIMTGSWVMLIGVLIQVTAFAGHHSGTQFIIGRIVTGLGNGANTATIPTWHAETSKSHNRGLLVCIEASTIAFGTAIAVSTDRITDLFKVLIFRFSLSIGSTLLSLLTLPVSVGEFQLLSNVFSPSCF